MVRTSVIVSCAFAAAVARADVSSSWTSFSWSSAGGATLEQHEVVRSDGGQMHEQVDKLTSNGDKVLEQVDVMSIGGRVFALEQVDASTSDGEVHERVQVADDGQGKLRGTKDHVHCVGGWCTESMSFLDNAGPGQPLRERPLVASGWRTTGRAPGLRGASPGVRHVHVPCHRGQPSASASTREFEVKESMTLTVDDPEAFVADPRSVEAVRVAIARQAGVDPKYVHVTLSVGARPAHTEEVAKPEDAGHALSKLVPVGAALTSALCFLAALLAPSARRNRKRATWSRQLRAGSRLEAFYDGEWFPATLSTGQKTPEGYWVVQCDADVDGQMLYTMDIRPEGATTVATPPTPQTDDARAALMPAALKNPVLGHASGAALSEGAAVQAYVLNLYVREAVAAEGWAVRAYTSRVVSRALVV